MTGGEEKPKNGGGKGFAGLSSLVSDVDTTPPPAAKKEPTAAPSAPRPAPQPTQPQPPPTQHQTHQAPAQPSSDSFGGKWLLGIIAVTGVIIWLASHSDNTGTSTTPVYDPSKQASNFDQDEVSKKSSESEPPKFSDYLSEPYDGPRASVNLVSDFDKNFRTRIRGTQSQPVNFAGEYVLSTWGCGTSCSMGVAVSSRTGRVVALPGTACCWKGEGERVIFKKNSRLLVLAGLINEGGKYGAHFYELKNDQFVHVKTIVVKEDDSGPASSAESAPQAYPSPSTSQQAPSRPTEAKPPVGQNLVLSREQIRYCLAEDIRMDGAKSAINNYIDADVARFNAMVADYNSRCSSFQYQTNNRGRNDLNSAQRDIEPFRSQLQSEGRSRFARSPTGALSPQTPSRPTPDATVQAIQRKLNELGYKAGAADGLMGRGTRSAVIAFQQDRGLAATGVADQTLLLQLQRAPARSTGDWYANDPVVQEAPTRSATTAPLLAPPSPSANRSGPPANSFVSGLNWYCNEGFKKVGNQCEAVAVPDNAFVSGSNWYCKEGFRKVGNECEALVVPRNAFVSGSNWYCKEGFRKVGNQCEALVLPDNAFVSGSNWYCKEGFRKIRNECEALVVPQNAFVSGSNWYCKEGFRKVGSQCEALIVPANAFVSGSNWYCNEGFRKAGDKCVSAFRSKGM